MITNITGFRYNFCPSCGKKNDGNNYCPHCGEELSRGCATGPYYPFTKYPGSPYVTFTTSNTSSPN